ncbi:MAG: His/Gly/Thr/Pro-type tRNA ligase C-terminal domain-containing protein, partial [Bacteroidota bacterium]
GNFPLWLTPTQAIVLPISEKYQNYAEKVSQFLNNSDIRTQIDGRNEKAGKKIRDAEMLKVPYMLIVGEREEADQTVSVRKHGAGDLGPVSLSDFVSRVQKEVEEQLGELN